MAEFSRGTVDGAGQKAVFALINRPSSFRMSTRAPAVRPEETNFPLQ
ncbi:hypothetical protein J2W25_005914 [Variovorax boronicumulans]|uniref:Uncharacterized protein n=1 Tax=Variovorax boronicumulans TaxID=436515 RepID=A0AAW8E4Q8_9BURK|nr:hypothetical protein [Variovorax boronicumulans]MDP9926865.1 hypothetical protein [Variovorax boronicumulans]